MNRRQFLFLGLSLAASLPFLGKTIKKVQAEQKKVKIDISNMEENEVRSEGWGDKTVYVRKQEGELKVFVGNCPHQGCVVSVSEDGWLCPCHKARFDKNGKVLSGPTNKDLEIPPYKIIGDTVEIG